MEWGASLGTESRLYEVVNILDSIGRFFVKYRFFITITFLEEHALA